MLPDLAGATVTLQALTLKQPWPALMLLDEQPKRIENRDYPPPRKLIGGYLALHGGRLPSGKAAFDEARRDLEWVDEYIFEAEDNAWDDRDILSICVPGIYAVARVLDVVTASDDLWFTGPFGWVLGDFTALEPPVPCKGAQGLWYVPQEALALVRERWKLARAPLPPPAAPPLLPPPPETAAKRAERLEAIQAVKDAREKVRYVAYLHLLCRLRAFRDPYFASATVQAARLAGLEASPLSELRQERRSRFAWCAYRDSLPLWLWLGRWRHERRALGWGVGA